MTVLTGSVLVVDIVLITVNSVKDTVLSPENSKLLMNADVLQEVNILYDQPLFKKIRTHLHRCPYCNLGTKLDLCETTVITELCDNTIILQRSNG